jgi:hypothetical protein
LHDGLLEYRSNSKSCSASSTREFIVSHSTKKEVCQVSAVTLSGSTAGLINVIPGVKPASDDCMLFLEKIPEKVLERI